ncbi:hypothetical protein QJ856_gp0605 [Tupanvirus deep ocean]|uniref:Uncharacterized protein n=2 Tax=Tupanvirus TaxID=2094720 RepID=A0AC62A8P3_9VIRU|nr:hypothetical protein QJ856_gp0605 [Tupanvirus deep ocean]QKU34141.1 hypothetical protein [Tupanvirus deep ocean]
MAIKIPNFVHRYKFWFYFRKGLFQVFFPILLAFMSFCDFVNQSGKENNGYAYDHLYFYTSLILFMYTGMRYILEFIFAMSSDDIIFKKEINLNQTTPELLLSMNMTNSQTDLHFMITIKKIFKLRYSNSPYFKYIDKACWFLGIDSPILIPENIVKRLGNLKENLTLDNEETFLHTTLLNLYAHHPRQYDVVPVDDGFNHASSMEESLVPKRVITREDKTICDLQKELFNKQNDMLVPNVV